MLEMIGALGSGLVQCFTWSTFSLMCIGIAIGFVVGILPGLGGPTAMALMLHLGGQGFVHTRTLRAFTAQEMEKILEESAD